MNKRFVSAGALAVFAVTALSAAPKYISPNNDGIQDELVIPLNISEKRYIQAWSLVIMDSKHNVVRVIENKVALPEKVGFKSFFKQLVTPKQGVVVPSEVTWNGVMNNGETAPDGTYYYYITATDDNGNKGQTKEYEVIVDTRAPEIQLAQPGDKIFGEGAKSAFTVRQSGSKEDEWIGTFRAADGTAVRTERWTNAEPAEFNWYGTNDDGAQVADGIYSYEITATDRAGNIAPKSVITNIIYSADKPATSIFVEGSRYFSPRTESRLQNVTFNLTVPTPDARTGNRLTEWAVNVKDQKGKVVRSFNQEKNGANPPSSIIFDGTDDDGKLLSDGQYQAVVSAKYLNGYVPAEISSAFVVLDTEKPSATITASEKTFGAGKKDSVTFSIAIASSSGAPVYAWRGEIRNADTGAVVREYSFNEYPPQTVVWNGISDKGGISDAGDYVFVLSGTDMAGNAGGGTTTQAVTFSQDEAQLLLAVSATAFAPKEGSSGSTITFNPVTSTKSVSSYNFAIKDAKGKVVYSQGDESDSFISLPQSFVWDGKNSEKIICADGVYSAQLSLVAANGADASASTQNFEIDTQAPSLEAETSWTAFSPNGNGTQKNLPVKIKNITAEKLWNAEVRNASGKAVCKFSWSGKKDSLTWNGTDDSGNMVADGIYSVVFFSTDEAGNSFSTELKGISLDNRETKGYVTADLEGISPNGDGVLESQKFAIRASVTDNIVSWNFDVRKENGSSVYSVSEKDAERLPATINWNGKGADNNPCEGTFIGTLDIKYANGNSVSAVSAPFVCTATPPKLTVQTSPQYFSPDNDGTDDDLFIRLSGTTKADIKSWSFTIKDPLGLDFWRTNGKSQITERIVWDGLSNVQKDASGKAERVQSAMDYPYVFTVTDTVGMTSTIEGVIPVDVLVIRDGNVLKMAVPSIIFESDAANFQKASGKLTKEQVDNNIKVLNRIADILKKFKDYKVTVVGHANKVTNNPDEETVDNPREWGRASMPLSKERADAIKVYLTKRGVSASVLSTDGMGGTRPVVDPKDKNNNWKNRRVEFILEK